MRGSAVRRTVLVGLAAAVLLLAGQARAEMPIPPELPAVVDEVEVNGTWRTRAHVVPRELPWKPGALVTPEAWALGVQRVWNIGVFSRVDARIEERDGRKVAVFDLEERWTVNLLFRYGVGGDAAWFQVGTYDINTLGRYIESGVLYERFGRFNGGQLWLRNPRLFDQRLDGMLTADRLTRPRPGFVLVRTRAQADLVKEHHDYFRYGGRIVGMDDRFSQTAELDVLPVPSRTLTMGGMVRFGLVSWERLRQRSWSLEFRPTVAVTDAPDGGVFGQLWAELLWFRLVGERWNLAVRAQAGAMTGAQPQHQFFIGGLDLVRGFPDNHLRALHFALVNFEARWIAWDSTWLALMPTAFVDGVVARDEQARGLGAFSTGAGIRILSPRLVRSGIRIDYAVPLERGRRPNVTLGVFHFFFGQ